MSREKPPKVSGNPSVVNEANRRWSSKALFFAIWLMLSGLGSAAQAQQINKIPRVGLLLAAGTSDSSRRDAFREGLHDLGYVEGKNI